MSGTGRLPRSHAGARPADGSREAKATVPADRGLVLATRGSALALAQTRLVGAALTDVDPHVAWRILPITTRGDRSAGADGAGATAQLEPAGRGPDSAPIAAGGGNGRKKRGGGSDLRSGAGGTADSATGRAGAPARLRERPPSGSRLAALARVSPGLFTSEVAAAVVRGEAAAAVHSLKDLPLDDHHGLAVAALLPRAAPGDVLVVAPEWFDDAAPLGLRREAAVGTSSPRRTALLRHFAPQARVQEVRGNVPTRLRRCAKGELAAVVLAQAGLQRLGAAAQGLRLVPLPTEHWQPAPGQGAIAVQARRHGAAAALLAAIDHAPTRTAVALERAVLRALGGGCATACGAYARPAGDGEWELHYGLADPGGGWRSYRLRDSAAGCRSVLAAWAQGGPLPGCELSAVTARDGTAAVLFGTT